MLEHHVETRPWAEQLAADDESFRAQPAYLFERSAFYSFSASSGLRRGDVSG
jgi:hypothetical protein